MSKNPNSAAAVFVAEREFFNRVLDAMVEAVEQNDDKNTSFAAFESWLKSLSDKELCRLAITNILVSAMLDAIRRHGLKRMRDNSRFMELSLMRYAELLEAQE